MRWRTIASGYYDYQIKRYVKDISYEQAAKNLALRHEIVTGQDQVIKKTTLEEYFFLINQATKSEPPFDFEKNQDELWSVLRRHCGR